MAEKLVVVSDMWGTQKGLWITSYLGYLQQYFDIVFYDSREMAQIGSEPLTSDQVYAAFINGGRDRAVAQLLHKEQTQSYYLTFCAGGTIAWHAALMGLPIKSLYAVSPIDLEDQVLGLDCPVTVLLGENDKVIGTDWAVRTGARVETIPNFGHDMYSDEKIIQKVCLDLLDIVLKKHYQV
ncbi:MAG: alpha/beta hydrolase [Flavobacteriaceae bacterium]